MLEKEIQKTILDYLAYKRIFHWKVNNVGTYRQDTGSYIPSGMLGVPDIIIVIDGKFIGCEVKSRTGRQSTSQARFEKDVTEAGGIYFIARSVDDVAERLKEIS